eukprot:scaffold41942_cov72-Cyclotella_meneghiniana.AAC.2
MDGLNRAVFIFFGYELEKYIGGEGKERHDDNDDASGKHAAASHRVGLSTARTINEQSCTPRRFVVKDE